MNVLSLLLENLAQGVATFRFPDSPPICSNYRGLVQFDPSKCDGCGMCSFVCTSGAIKGKRRKDNYDWSYDPALCTFCGRCVDVCAPHNLTMQSSRPPVYIRIGELKVAYTVIRKPAVPAQPAATTAPVASSVSGGSQ